LKYPSFDERRAFGRSRRHVVKRSAQARWEPSRRKHDPLEIIRATNRERIRELVPLKMARMAASPFGFYRGSVELMAADLALLPVSGLCAQICGDAHVRNLGAFAAPDGRLLFDLNDFDETIYGPWEWDVKRLAVSLVLAGREGENSDAVCRQAVRDFMRMYRGKMLEFAELPVIEVARYRVRRAFRGAPGSAVLRKAERATPQHWLKTLTGRKGDPARVETKNAGQDVFQFQNRAGTGNSHRTEAAYRSWLQRMECEKMAMTPAPATYTHLPPRLATGCWVCLTDNPAKFF
jgi:Uncharacterized protein conserved in bacteria (DUF2252)